MNNNKKQVKELGRIIDNILEASTRDDFDYIEFVSSLAKNGFGEKYIIAKLGRFVAVTSESCTLDDGFYTEYNETVAPLIFILSASEKSSIRTSGINYKELYK